MFICKYNTENEHISYLLFSYPFPTNGTIGHLKCHSVFFALCTNCQRQLMITVSQGFINNQQDCKTLPQLHWLAVLIWQFPFVCHYQLFTLLVPWKKTACSLWRSPTKLVSEGPVPSFCRKGALNVRLSAIYTYRRQKGSQSMPFRLGLFIILWRDLHISCSAAGQTRSYLLLEPGDYQIETVNLALHPT